MLFNLEHDHGDIIEGYLIPDGFSDKPVVKVTLDDGSSFVLPCDQMRKAAQESGRHMTGLVGFRLDQSNTAELAQQSSLSIHDANTGLLIYRRPGLEKLLDIKLFRLELRMIPTTRLDIHCGRYFQYAMSTAERFGNETTLQMFHLNAIKSIYIGGRLRLRGYEEFLDKGFKFVCSIPEPYYEMASRLFILKRLSQQSVSFISDRDSILMKQAAQHFDEVNLEDEDQIKRALKKANDKVKNILVSPVTRQIVCRDAEQKVTRQDIAGALDLTSRFTAVGYDNDDGHFEQTLGEIIKISPHEIPITPRYSYLGGKVAQYADC